MTLLTENWQHKEQMELCVFPFWQIHVYKNDLEEERYPCFTDS